MEKVYVLKLEHDKFYVGRAQNVLMKLQLHLTGRVNQWTKDHPVIDIVEVSDSRTVDKIVIKYMHKYGIENVRGGSFSRIELNERDIEIINKHLKRVTCPPAPHCVCCQTEENLLDTHFGPMCCRCSSGNRRTELCCSYEDFYDDI